jgi:uncharacterized protein (DUF427 family)
MAHAARRHPVPDDTLTYEPSDRRVRGTVGGTTVIDSRRPVLVWEPDSAVPLYAFPRDDIRTDLLTPSSDSPATRHHGAGTWYDLTVDGERITAIAWYYSVPELAGLLAFEWFGRTGPGIEHWYEEDEEIFVHPRDPYKRVDAIPSSRHVEVRINGVLVADTHRPVLLFETRLPVRYYIPAEDVDFTSLTETELHTRCPYKGIARYWSFVGDPPMGNVVWSYPAPIAAVAPVKDLLAFYNEAVDITVDGEAQERPVTLFSSRVNSGQ